MATVIGSGTNAKLFLPLSTVSWKIKGIVKKGEYDNVVLLAFSLHDQEVVDVRRCFDETTHIFSFGRDVANNVFQVSLLLFLGKGCQKTKYLTLSDIVKVYEKSRIYNHTSPITVTIGEFTIKGFLVEMGIGGTNPSTGTCVITFSFILDQGV